MAKRRRFSSSGFRIKMRPCLRCPKSTAARLRRDGEDHTIVCIRCGQVLKRWTPPVMWIDGEPVPVRFGAAG